VPPGPFRAVSLDLWFTTLSFEAEAMDVWRDARTRVLREVIVGADGRSPSPDDILSAQRALRSSSAPGTADGLDPLQYLTLVVEEMGGRFRGDPARAARLYSAAGLKEAPPRINAEAVALCRALAERSVPTICITNTGRRAESWARFFQENAGPRFEHIVTSCEVGRAKPLPEIFQEASRKLGIPCQGILHIGDRWDIDVAGARGVGMGAVLYRGLWDRYPEVADREVSERLDDRGTDVVRIDRLDEVLRDGLVRGPS
jgi:FMN phosphatase YigB (HAD superfamily)